jgi:UTP--glucose-1-phosphate uridylyltransferase
MGSAVGAFPGAAAIQVNRERFIPVKKTNDLLAVWSDCYVLDTDCRVRPNPDRGLGTIFIKLDSSYFKKIDQMTRRFSSGVPSLIDCSSLEIKGDFAFGRDVVCQGDVLLENQGPNQVFIPDGSLLKGRQTWGE